MGLPENGKQNKLPFRDPPLAETAGDISSLNEAWFQTLDRCVADGPLVEIILPLMRDCFFGGAMHAVLLMQKGHGEQLASDIARFIVEEPVTPEGVQARSSTGPTASCAILDPVAGELIGTVALPLMRTPIGTVAPNSGVQRGPVNEEF